MLVYDFNRPFKEPSAMESYNARAKQTAQRYGKTVKAMTITNRE